MGICILSMDRPAIGLRLPKLPILIAALWTITPSRQLQTFVPVMSEERIIPMQFSLLSFIPLLFLLTLVFLLFRPTLIILFFCRCHLFNRIRDVTRGFIVPSFDISPCSYRLFYLSRRLLISLYSSADICILGSIVPASLDLTDVRTLVFLWLAQHQQCFDLLGKDYHQLSFSKACQIWAFLAE